MISFILEFGNFLILLSPIMMCFVGLFLKWIALYNKEFSCCADFSFALAVFAWIFFRSNNISDAFYVINNMFSDIGDYTDFEKMKLNLRGLGVGINDIIISVGLVAFMECYNLYERSGDVWGKLENKPRWIRWGVYYILLFGILFLAPYSRVSNFIYFQF